MFRFRALANRVLLRAPTKIPNPLSVAPRVFAVVSTNKFVPQRTFATLTEQEIQKRLDDFQELFVEARLSIEDATDSLGTTYYEEDADAAIEAVDEAVAAFEQLINDIEDEKEKNRILRGNGLKVEQLKGELEMALKGGDDHH
jgi:uncharacterized protein (DUF2164 family)